MEEYTKGTLLHSGTSASIVRENFRQTVFLTPLGMYGNERRANARRLVAAWNYFTGVPTEEIESMASGVDFWRGKIIELKQKAQGSTQSQDMTNTEEEVYNTDFRKIASRIERLEAENAALRAALRNVLSTGLNGGNNVRLAFISASQKPLSNEDIERAEKSEIATNVALELLSNENYKIEENK